METVRAIMRYTDQTPGPDAHDRETDQRRGIGVMGTCARIVVGLLLLTSVAQGQLRAGFAPGSWALGLVGFPALLLAWQWLRARRTQTRLRATGLLAFALNCLIFLALYLTPWYAPAFSVTSDAALTFYGISMVLAALRGYAGCEVTAVSNWLLRRDDQIGCVLFGPIDHLERRQAPSVDG
jgi:hypothetical protein